MKQLEYLLQYHGTHKDTLTHSVLDCECEEDTLYYYQGEELIGQLSLFIEDARVCMFDVEIMPEFRSQGYGKKMLHHFLSDEWPYLAEIFPIEEHPRKLVLQVSENNVAAVKLYQSFQFEVIDQVILEDGDLL